MNIGGHCSPCIGCNIDSNPGCNPRFTCAVKANLVINIWSFCLNFRLTMTFESKIPVGTSIKMPDRHPPAHSQGDCCRLLGTMEIWWCWYTKVLVEYYKIVTMCHIEAVATRRRHCGELPSGEKAMCNLINGHNPDLPSRTWKLIFFDNN